MEPGVSHRPDDSLEYRVAALESELREVHLRNRRVASHKAWETSRTRLVSITLVTYVTMFFVFLVLGSGRPLLDALVPTTGFFLSTLSLPLARSLWEKRLGTDSALDQHSRTSNDVVQLPRSSNQGDATASR